MFQSLLKQLRAAFTKTRPIRKGTRAAVLRLEPLEDRFLPDANIALTNAFLVDSNNNALTAAPAVGEQVFLHADFTTQDLPTDASYQIDFTLDGNPLSSGPLTWGAGDSGTGTWDYYLGAGFIAAGDHNVSVAINPDPSAPDTTADGSTINFDFTPVPAAGLPQQLINPLGGTQFQTWSAYIPTDPPYRSGDHDFGLANFAAMDAGIPVLAAVSGTVTATQDGNFDRRTVGDGTNGNFVTIDSGNGWTEDYFHFRTDTILVRPGDTVVQGQVLGLVGSAGNSSGPHACFQLYHNGDAVEADYDPPAYYVDPLPVAGTDPAILSSGVTTDPNSLSADISAEERPVNANTLTQADGQQINVWFSGITWDNTDVTYRFYAPDGSDYTPLDDSFTVGETIGGWWDQAINVPPNLDLGTWQVGIEINGTEMARDSFQVTTDGAPTAQVTRDGAVVGNGRTTPIDFGTADPGDAAPQVTFTVENVGNADLTPGNLVLPDGFSLASDFPGDIAPGSSADFTVALNTDNPGTRTGVLSFDTNDPNTPTFSFTVKGRVTGGSNGEVHGQVFQDDNGDGTESGSEAGTPGWSVSLLDPTDNSVIATTTTGNNGFYAFYNLADGTYRVRETPPDGWAQTTADPADVTVAGGDDLASPFGVVQSAPPDSPPPASPPPAAPPPSNRPFNFDKLGAYRPGDGSWSLDSDGAFGFNAATDQVFTHFSPAGVTGVAGDWSGTGRANIGDFSNGVWHLDLNGNGVVDPNETFTFGQAGDKPVVGDWTGDGVTKLGVFRRAPDGITGEFILDVANHKTMDDSNLVFTFGLATDRIVVGDWTGDGISKVGVFRDAAAYGAPGAAVFSLDLNHDHTFDSGDQVFIFGRITDGLVIGDWNGDGTDKVGVYRDGSAGFNAPGVALFSLDTNGNRQYDPGVDAVFLYGLTSDQFVAGNWVVTPPLQPAEFALGGRGPGDVPTLTNAELAPVLQQAIADWTAHGANAALLAGARVSIGRLHGALVGWTGPDQITLDGTAAGWGWFVDPTPGRNEEFPEPSAAGLRASTGSAAAGKMDLLTVVEHELGHELGLNDLDPAAHPGDLMASTLPTGTRRMIGG
jgi:murein DD-endopeptidase MepM/ murein hydrolase activator NlpD